MKEGNETIEEELPIVLDNIATWINLNRTLISDNLQS